MCKYEYTHGGNIYDESGIEYADILDFSANINPLGMMTEVVSAAQEAVLKSNIYPDSNCRKLISKILEFEKIKNIDYNNIFCSNGASNIIFRLVFTVKPKKILVTAPSFLDYERAGRASDSEIIYFKLREESNFNIDYSIIEKIKNTQPDIVFICNPNNPTGSLAKFDLIKDIAEICKSINAFLLVDECFLDFVENAAELSAKLLLGEYKNIILLKAFTKIFAIPGLRLGYAVCSDNNLIDKLKLHGADWSVSNIAQAAGTAALENGAKYIKNTVEFLKKERSFLVEKFENAGLKVYNPSANFIFFRCPWEKRLSEKLKNRNILIRDCGNYKGICSKSGYYRTAVLTREKNLRLIDALEQIKSESGVK